ncbi:BPL-N domain-containing protein [Pseudoleptotrichia goodfellowii]|uniref:Biotin-protein ligase N-terminal domain-containing protein n=1 Tax=Pseudoleptotrichia goodfellowii TaxID=157692 RepID=A0A510JBY7_9FUSO|nr:BPL-N domain-containing protein [Pseudoleptotrichia goodfellowii]BBM36838.1 hypothetical protein JCM16774_1784 [Pseudoleptotrichia goodfellowii]
MGKVILIYGDEGASRVGVSSLLKACKEKMGHPVKEIFASDIINDNILDKAAMVVFPGGVAMPYCNKLNGIGNKKIREYLKNGGVYLGICAGAYYACDRLDFHGEEYDVVDKWELEFFKGVAKGSLAELTNGRYYDESVYAKAFVPLKFDGKYSTVKEKMYYYHGGPTFIPDDKNDDSYEAIAKFENGKTAIIKGKFGNGSYFLSSIHFELQKKYYKEIVLDKARKEEYEQETELYNCLNDNYGNEIWEIIKKEIINVRSSLLE